MAENCRHVLPRDPCRDRDAKSDPQIAVAVTMQNDIVRLLNAGIGYVFNLYVMWTVIRQCFHAASGVTVNVAFDYVRVAIPERLPEKQAGFRRLSRKYTTF